MAASDDDIAQVLMRLARERGQEKSFCPSEAARALEDDWRTLMPDVRRVAALLPLVATRRGKPVHPEDEGGPIRLRLAHDA